MTPTPEPADAGETIRQLRAERDRLHGQYLAVAGDKVLLRSELAGLRTAILAATDPAAISDALRDVHDRDVSLDDYAAAVSRAIRKSLGIT